MSLRFNMKRAAAMSALGCVCVAPAAAQSIPPISYQPLSFNAAGSKQMWHTVMLVSAGVAILGLLQDDSTLVILGAAGVLLAFVESQPSSFRMNSARQGFDLAKTGPLSLGLNPLGRTSLWHGTTGPRPGAYVRLSFKF
jgi:hypothetical protein